MEQSHADMEAALVCFKYFLMKDSGVEEASGKRGDENPLLQRSTSSKPSTEADRGQGKLRGEGAGDGLSGKDSAGSSFVSVLDAQVLVLQHHLDSIYQAPDPPCIARQVQQLENILARAKARQAERAALPIQNAVTRPCANAVAVTCPVDLGGDEQGHYVPLPQRVAEGDSGGCVSVEDRGAWAEEQRRMHDLTNAGFPGSPREVESCAPLLDFNGFLEGHVSMSGLIAHGIRESQGRSAAPAAGREVWQQQPPPSLLLLPAAASGSIRAEGIQPRVPVSPAAAAGRGGAVRAVWQQPRGGNASAASASGVGTSWECSGRD